LDIYWRNEMEELVACILERSIRIKVDVISPLKFNGGICPISLSKTDWLWLGLNNIFSVLYHNSTL